MEGVQRTLYRSQSGSKPNGDFCLERMFALKWHLFLISNRISVTSIASKIVFNISKILYLGYSWDFRDRKSWKCLSKLLFILSLL